MSDDARGIGPGWVRSATTAVLMLGLGIFAEARARAQTPPAGEAPRQVGDLSTRFRFIERYAVDPARAKPQDVTQYRVASRDVIKAVAEKPQGAPDRTERTVQIIYTERPTVVNSQGVVTDTVRRYDAFRVTPMPEVRPSFPKPLEGLNVWFRNRPGSAPLLMSLDGGRLLTEAEYAITLRQIFLPDLSSALPTLPSRVGDRWRLPKLAAQSLLNEQPTQSGEPLIGTLLDVRKVGDGAEHSAVIGVSGKVMLSGGETLLNAQIVFTFAAPDESDPSDGAVDARGTITEVRLARASSSAIPGSEGRLKLSLTWELILQRERDQGGSLLPAPTSPPSPTESNSWLTYDDPKGRFHFRHPEDYLPQNLAGLAQDDIVQLADARAGANDGRVITFKFQSPTGDVQNDRDQRDPEFHVKELNEDWIRSKQDVLRGPAGWLPEAEWAPYKMQVYRIEAALKPSGPAARNLQRIFLDHYLVKFAQNESLVIDAMTGQDPPTAFRQEVEAIVKTFTLGPPKSSDAPPSVLQPPSP
ncbi:MAG: hypothetical protein AB7I30_18260 [Isosphaeraceae bacterium]